MLKYFAYVSFHFNPKKNPLPPAVEEIHCSPLLDYQLIYPRMAWSDEAPFHLSMEVAKGSSGRLPSPFFISNTKRTSTNVTRKRIGRNESFGWPPNAILAFWKAKLPSPPKGCRGCPSSTWSLNLIQYPFCFRLQWTILQWLYTYCTEHSNPKKGNAMRWWAKYRRKS